MKTYENITTKNNKSISQNTIDLISFDLGLNIRQFF